MHELVELGKARYQAAKDTKAWLAPTSNEEANRYYNDIDSYPHIFVLGCLMDKQIKAERAWEIPYNLCRDFGCFDMRGLSEIPAEEIEEWFARNRPHRYNAEMARVFYEAVQRIHGEYGDDASAIWSGCPSSAEVVYRFLQFRGAGIKIATMAANILARDYHVDLKDYYSIDISPDIQVKRIFHRLGLVPNEAKTEMVIYKARELNPEFPGVIDLACWEIGRKWCHPNNPNCGECPLSGCCRFSFR